MEPTRLCKPWEHRISRRQWLGAAAGSAALGLGALDGLGGANGLSAAQAALGADGEAAAKSPANDRQVLFLWIDGGMSQLESWDPKPNTKFGGPFRSIETSVPGIRISELMPRTAKVMHHLAVVRSICTKDNSHSAGVARIQRGDPKNRGVTYPFFGSAVARLLGPGDSGLPPYVWVKPGSGGFIHQDGGFLGPRYGAVAFGDGQPPENMTRPESVSADEDEARNEIRELLDRRYAAAHRTDASLAQAAVFRTARTLMRRQDLFDTSAVDPRDRQRYGEHEFGRHVLQGRKMIEAGVRFVKVNSYGWDTHGDNFNGHLSLMARFDQAYASVVEDLADRGLLDRVLVVAMSEFGRTPRINGHVGRDHWPEAWSIPLAGPGLKKGLVVGATNDEGTFVATEPYDIGHVYHTWFRSLGIDPTKTEYDNHGQPLPIAHDDMGPIAEVLA